MNSTRDALNSLAFDDTKGIHNLRGANEINEQREFDKASKKLEEFGALSLTSKDHWAIHSTPPTELVENPGKAHYELLTEDKIKELLEFAIECMYEPKYVMNGFARQQKTFFVTTHALLKSVGRLPAEYENFDLEKLPEIK